VGPGSTNAEIVASAYEALNQGDMRTFLGLIDREVEWRARPDGTDPDTYEGAAGVGRFFETRLDVWDDYAQEPQRLIDAGDDSVVAMVTIRGKGRASGIEVEERSGHVWRIRDGKVVSFHAFDEPEQALAAAGLPADT
jgi:ketosteroid isomerase-like protein